MTGKSSTILRVYWLPQICRLLRTSISSALMANSSPRLTSRPVSTARTFSSLPAASGLTSLLLYRTTELNDRTDSFGQLREVVDDAFGDAVAEIFGGRVARPR